MKHAAIFAALVLAACATANAPGDADAGIAANRRAFVDNARAGNAAALVAGYTEDAILMPPNAPVVRGRAAIQQFWGGFLALGKIDLKLTPLRVRSSGDLGAESGTYDLTITPPSGAPIHDVGKYTVTLRYVGSQWLLDTDIFNSDLPPPPPPR